MAEQETQVLAAGCVVSLRRRGISPSARYLVKRVGDTSHSVYAEGGDAKTDYFRVFTREIGEILERPIPKSELKPAKDRTGEEVKRMVYLPGEGYFAYLQRSLGQKTRIAPIVDRKISGSGELRPTTEVGRVYNCLFQPPPVRNKILSMPTTAESPEVLGLTPEQLDAPLEDV